MYIHVKRTRLDGKTKDDKSKTTLLFSRWEQNNNNNNHNIAITIGLTIQNKIHILTESRCNTLNIIARWPPRRRILLHYY